MKVTSTYLRTTVVLELDDDDEFIFQQPSGRRSQVFYLRLDYALEDSTIVISSVQVRSYAFKNDGTVGERSLRPYMSAAEIPPEVKAMADDAARARFERAHDTLHVGVKVA